MILADINNETEVVELPTTKNFKASTVISKNDEKTVIVDNDEKKPKTKTIVKYQYYVSFTCKRSNNQPDIMAGFTIQLDRTITRAIDIDTLRKVTKSTIEERYNKDQSIKLGDPFIIAFSYMGPVNLTVEIDDDEEQEE